jgi:SAM-dependent methyltransferase
MQSFTGKGVDLVKAESVSAIVEKAKLSSEYKEVTMILATETQTLDRFLDYIVKHEKTWWYSIEKNISKNRELFYKVGVTLTNYAANYIGEGYEKVLADGYVSFVADVTMSQMQYERSKHYPHKSYEEVYNDLYNNPEDMSQYHWGVYAITFLWEHHLKVYQFFENNFLSQIADIPQGTVLELGSGSGLWGMFLLNQLKDWKVVGVDISKTSVETAREQARFNGISNRAHYVVDNALTFMREKQFDAAISCFLLEHLEHPGQLFANIANNLKPGGYAFVTGALTAAERDHIYEFKRESELLLLAEENGFRVISSLSAAPDSDPRKYNFLPRSMCLLLQKRRNDIW